MALFDTLGFEWNRNSVPQEIPRVSLERVVFRFHRMLPEYVWDAGVLEGCHPEAAQIRQLNPGLSAVKDLPKIQYFTLSDSMKK